MSAEKEEVFVTKCVCRCLQKKKKGFVTEKRLLMFAEKKVFVTKSVCRCLQKKKKVLEQKSVCRQSDENLQTFIDSMYGNEKRSSTVGAKDQRPQIQVLRILLSFEEVKDRNKLN